MLRHKWISALIAVLMAAVVVITGFAVLCPDALAPLTAAYQPVYVQAMDKTRVLSVVVEADAAQWAEMLENATQEEYIPANVTINGVTVSNVGIRPKGNSSLSTVAGDDTTDRYSFKIEFDHYIDGQSWLGLDKLALNNIQSDASYMKEYLSYDIMEYLGVASPLYAFADISVNGADWGFYLAVETLEDSYAQRTFGSDHGQLYKPDSMGNRGNGQMNEMLREQENAQEESPAGAATAQAADTDKEAAPANERGGRRFGGMGGGGGPGGGMASNGVSLQYTDDELSSYSAIFDTAVFQSTDLDYRRVITALKKLDAGGDPADCVEVEAVLRYFAAHTVVVNLDSYVSNMGHNYYLYEENGKLCILPWDYNLAFGGFQSRNASAVVNFPIDTPVSGVSLEDRPLLGRLLEVPEYLERYHAYLNEIVQGYFNSGVFAQTMDSLDATIADYVQKDPSAFYTFEEYQAAVAELRELALLRAQSIEGQLAGTIPSTTEAQSANPALLVDASGIDLSALGSQGGGGGPGGGNNGAMPEGADREVQRAAMESLRAQGGFGGGPGAPPPERNGESPGVGASAFDTNTWIVLGVCAAALLAGLIIVLRFKRRREL